MMDKDGGPSKGSIPNFNAKTDGVTGAGLRGTTGVILRLWNARFAAGDDEMLGEGWRSRTKNSYLLEVMFRCRCGSVKQGSTPCTLAQAHRPTASIERLSFAAGASASWSVLSAPTTIRCTHPSLV